jgi:hypothetical protein
MGFDKEAGWHAQIARDLFYRADSQQLVTTIVNEGTFRFVTYGSYLLAK